VQYSYLKLKASVNQCNRFVSLIPMINSNRIYFVKPLTLRNPGVNVVYFAFYLSCIWGICICIISPADVMCLQVCFMAVILRWN